MCSKESAAAIAAIVLLYEALWWKQRKRDANLAWALAAVWIPVAAVWWARSVVLDAAGPALRPFTDNPIFGADFLTGRLTALTVLPRALALFAWPAHLSFDYSYPAIELFTGSAGNWEALVLVAAAAAGLVFLLRASRLAFFFALFAALTYLPASNLLVPIGTIFAERLLYLPFAGLSALLVLAIVEISGSLGRPRTAALVLAILTSAAAARTWVRNSVWTDNLTLARSATQGPVRSYKIHKLLAAALYNADPSRDNLDSVIAEAESGLALLDSLPDARNQAALYRDAGVYYSAKAARLAARGSDSRPSDLRALALLQRAASILRAQPSAGNPADLDPLLFSVELRLGDSGALALAGRARDMAPELPESHLRLAEAFLQAHQPDDAAKALMAGMILVGGPALRDRLIQIYASRNGSCALTQGQNGPAVNPACPAVQRDICAASADIMRLQLRRHRPDLAAQMKNIALSRYACDADPLNRAAP
jgi:hypothetical protein